MRPRTRPAATCRRPPGPIDRRKALVTGCWFLSTGLLESRGDPLQPPETGADPSRLGPPAPAVDESAARRAGIRRLDGRHLTLYTDLPARPAVDELPRVYDAAVAPWARYLGIEPSRVARWKLTGFLMRRKATFQTLGLLPDRLPPFRHGYQLGGALWAYDKPSDYYRRHLVLHEGVHGIMRQFLRGTGRPWFREGMAELLATHEWDGKRLRVDIMPARREDVPLLGRIKVVREAVARRRPLDLQQIFQYPDVTSVDQYAWCWAACYFLSHHPRYATRFRRLLKVCRQPVRFQSEVAGLFPPDDRTLDEDWQLFVDELDYGYDLPRAVVDYQAGRPWSSNTRTGQVDVTRSWHSSGMRLERGTTYELRVEGRYRIAVGRDGRPWMSEANGITIHYHRGRPVGMLLAAVRPDDWSPGKRSALLDPIPVGTGTTIRVEQSGTLYWRINEHPKTLHDNQGTLQVTVRRIP